MRDIVEQLRKHHADIGLTDNVESWLTVAADEIERLRQKPVKLDRLVEMLKEQDDEIKRLREALRDIAEDQEGDYDFIVWQARAALEEKA